MSAVQTLPPDQRAVLQLILKQGRGYADLSGLLKIDEDAVRARALAGLEALGGDDGQALSPRRRAQIADYLLGQQAPVERDATRTYLDDSAAARRWAGTLRAQLAPLARDPLPEVPAARANGRAPIGEAPAAATPPADEREPAVAAAHQLPADALTASAAHEPPADEPAVAAAHEPPADEPAARAAQEPAIAPRHSRGERATASASAPAPARPRRDASGPRRSSRLGGIVLIAGVAVLVAVLAIVLIGGSGDDKPAGEPATPTQAQSEDQQTTGDGDGAASAAQVLAQVNLNPADGSSAAGIGWVQRVDGRPMIAVQVQRIAPNGEQDVYAAWLRARDGSARFLGFVPSQVGRDGRFTVSAVLPGDLAGYDEVLVSRESISTAQTPTRPQDVVLTGALRLRG